MFTKWLLNIWPIFSLPFLISTELTVFSLSPFYFPSDRLEVMHSILILSVIYYQALDNYFDEQIL